jgi:type I restriction enzyme R subunit
MKQSIGEGFTLDVLKSFTPVNRYFKLKSKGDDVELPEKQGKKELIKWVDSNPETISRKVSVILDHLLNNTIKSINGRGKGMLIVRTIPDTVKYHTEINKQLKEKDLHNKIKILIGFSGTTDYNGEEITENYINKENGFDGSDIPEGFKNPKYKLLIVCDKFQTGFNEPLLHSMFVDKPLQGVQCVQTLSRLNRKKTGKNNTFILDFVNKIETIQNSFQGFYQTTILSKDTDPNSIYDLLDKIRHYDLVSLEEINEWSELFAFENRDDSKLQPILNQVIERWRNLADDEDKELSKSLIRSYCKLFGYLSMINQFDNIELYRHYLFFEYLKKKFPLDGIKKIDVSDLVDLDSLNLDIKGQINISLEDEDTVIDPNNPGGGKISDEEEYDLLSEIINDINEFYGKVPEGTEDSSKKLITELVNDDEFKNILFSENTESNKKDQLEKIYKDKNIKTLDTSTKLYEIFNQKEMRDRVINTLISRPEIINKYRDTI